jgi:hypothetical protein
MRRRRVPRAPYPVSQVAALILHRAGYRPEQISDLLQPHLVLPRIETVTADLVVEAERHLTAVGFTYYGVADAIEELRKQIGPAAIDESSADQQLDLFGGMTG